MNIDCRFLSILLFFVRYFVKCVSFFSKRDVYKLYMFVLIRIRIKRESLQKIILYKLFFWCSMSM